MKLETFFEKFDQFAAAPDAVSKMRELIMLSAFSGALSVEDRDNPMPAGWAIERAPTLPAIPASWKWQRGGQVFDVVRGVSYKKHEVSDSPVEGLFPVLRANNIGNGINFDGLVYVPRKNIRDEQFVRRGDILIAMSSGSKKLVGKAAPIVTEFKGSFGAFCGVVRNKSEIPDEVLARYFESPQYTSWVTAAGRGIGINNLKKGDLDSLPVPTPPLAEQKRIVAKVDELMALCDRLEAQQQEHDTRHDALARASLARFADAPIPANLQFLFHKSYDIEPADLRKSILTLAVQGKLVPQDLNDDPVEKSLMGNDERRTETAECDRRASAAKQPLLSAEDCWEVPSAWRWRGLADLVLFVDYRGKTPTKVSSGLRLLTAKNVRKGSINLEPEEHISESEYDAWMTRGFPNAGDVLFTTEAPMGNAAVIQLSERFALAQRVICFQGYGALDPHFLVLQLLSEPFQVILDKNGTGMTAKGIKAAKLKRLPFAVPPLSEQHRIVAKVDQLMTLVDELEKQLAASRATARNLLDALVTELTVAGASSPDVSV